MRSTLASLRSDIQQIKNQVNAPVEPHIIFDDLKFKLNHNDAVEYNPYSNSVSGTFEDFHNDKSKVRLLMGGFGSGKSTACCAEIVLQLRKMPAMKDGVRRARGAIIRNTMGELESTTMKTWGKWFGNNQLGIFLGHEKIKRKPNLIYTYTFYDELGKCELELFCIGLDLEKSKAKLESLELTFAYVNEAQHVPEGVIKHLIGRVGRYPAVTDIKDDYFAYVIADTNPPNNHHWMYRDFDSDKKIDGNRVFHQPHGLIRNADGLWIDNSKADNYKHLKDKYYYEMARANGFDQSYINTICNGEYGFSKEGKPVYTEYNDFVHSADVVDIIDDLPVVIGVDGGSTPAALVTQYTLDGQKRSIKEFVTHFSSARSLKENHVLPWVLNNLKEDQKVYIVYDPSMKKANENIEVSAAEIWEHDRWEVYSAKSNNISPRIEAEKKFLNKMIEGKPAFIMSRSGCPTYREAMATKYCYIEVQGKNNVYKDIPDKVHPHSDIADCGQYTAMEFIGDDSRINNDEEIDLSEFTEASLNSGWV